MFSWGSSFMKLNPIRTEEFGQSFLLANSDCEVKIFPALIQFFQIDRPNRVDLQLDIKGPIQKFLVEYDLEKSRLTVSLQTDDGFLKYQLKAENYRIYFYLDRVYSKGLKINQEIVSLRELREVFEIETIANSNPARLTLGSMKNKDAFMIVKNKEIETLLPWFFFLAQKIPSTVVAHFSEYIAKMIVDKRNLDKFFRMIFSSVLDGFFVPRSFDFTHQGLPEIFDSTYSNLSKIKALVQFFQNILIDVQNGTLSFLPHLPKSWHQGKLEDFKISNLNVSFSWSCGQIKKVEILSKIDQNLTLIFPKNIKSFRLKDGNRSYRTTDPLVTLKENSTLVVDCFQK